MTRLELATLCLEGRCSSQLSYTRSYKEKKSIVNIEDRVLKVCDTFQLVINNDIFVLISTILVLERWFIPTFRSGYLVTTLPQSLISFSIPIKNLQRISTPMVWRAVSARNRDIFTVTFWFTITSNSNFM